MQLLLLLLIACTHAPAPMLANATPTPGATVERWRVPHDFEGHQVLGETLVEPGALPVDVFALRGITRDEIAARLRGNASPSWLNNGVTGTTLPAGWLLDVDVRYTRVENTRVVVYREDLGIACEGAWNAVVGKRRGITREAARDHVVATCDRVR